MNQQPDPVPSLHPPVWPLVIADMRARDAVGRQRYGTPLQPFNGRNSLQDAYEEALDLCVYLKTAIIEAEAREKLVVGMAERIAKQSDLLSKRAERAESGTRCSCCGAEIRADNNMAVVNVKCYECSEKPPAAGTLRELVERWRSEAKKWRADIPSYREYTGEIGADAAKLRAIKLEGCAAELAAALDAMEKWYVSSPEIADAARDQPPPS